MGRKDKKDSIGDLKIRAIRAKQLLRERGINYSVMLQKLNPKLEASKIYRVANGQSSDEGITVLLEKLLENNSVQAE